MITNSLMGIAIPVAFVAVIVLFLVRNLLSQRVRIALGGAFVIVGIGALIATEFEYSTANTVALRAPLNLSREGRVLTATITPRLSGLYELFLQTDHTPGIEKFGCLTGEELFEAYCPHGDPELDAAWTVSENGMTIARGGSDLDAWRTRQAALDPAEAARRHAAYHTDMAKIENPADATPLFHSMGYFRVQSGHSYGLTLDLRKSAPTLAALHPRLEVGFSGGQTKGLGLFVIIFCLVCVLGGGGMILISREE